MKGVTLNKIIIYSQSNYTAFRNTATGYKYRYLISDSKMFKEELIH